MSSRAARDLQGMSTLSFDLIELGDALAELKASVDNDEISEANSLIG